MALTRLRFVYMQRTFKFAFATEYLQFISSLSKNYITIHLIAYVFILPFLGFKIWRAVNIMRREALWRFCRFRDEPPSEGFLNLYLRFTPLPEKLNLRKFVQDLVEICVLFLNVYSYFLKIFKVLKFKINLKNIHSSHFIIEFHTWWAMALFTFQSSFPANTSFMCRINATPAPPRILIF